MEFPWIHQLEASPSLDLSVLSSPTLIPSNAQVVYSSFEAPSPKSENEDSLILGFAEISEQSHRLILLRASLLPQEPTPDVNAYETGWDICHVWDTSEIRLDNDVATNDVARRYEADLKGLWEILSEHSKSQPFVAQNGAQEKLAGHSSRCHRLELQRLGTTFKNIGLPRTVFDESEVKGSASSPRAFTFRVRISSIAEC